MKKKDENSNLILEQILSITKENSQKIDQVNILVEKTKTNVENQNEILKSHAKNIEKNNDKLGEYNTQLEIHIQRTDLLEGEVNKVKDKCETFDTHVIEYNHSKDITGKWFKYSGIIIGAMASILGILRYLGKI